MRRGKQHAKTIRHCAHHHTPFAPADSAMVVGFMLLVTEGKRLSGMNNEQSRASMVRNRHWKSSPQTWARSFHHYAPGAKQVESWQPAPVLPPSTGVSYVDVLGNSTYSITYPKDGNGNPVSIRPDQIGSSAFQGMSALETTYTLTVAARTATGAS